MKNGQPQQTIVDYMVLSLASQEPVQKHLVFDNSTPYWEVKKKVIEAYGKDIFAEVRRLATMPWETLAADNWPLFVAYANKKTINHPRNRAKRGGVYALVEKMFRIGFDVKRLTPSQQDEVRQVIQSVQREWASCLPRTLDN